MSTTDLVAGRELDALVAEEVMGFCDVMTEYYVASADDAPELDVRAIPCFSTDIAAAWQVLDAMVWRVGTADIRLDMEDYGRGAMNDGGAECAVWVTIGEHTAFGPAPLAICRAALAAVSPPPSR